MFNDRPFVQLLKEEIVPIPMPVADHHFISPASKSPGNGRIHIRGQDAAETLPFGMPRGNLVPGRDSRGPFHIDGDQ